MKPNNYVDTKGIMTTDEFFKASTSIINDSYEEIVDSLNTIKKYLTVLNGYNNRHYFEGNMEKKLIISYTNYVSDFEAELRSSDVESGVKDLNNKSIFNLHQLADDLGRYIRGLKRELNFSDDDVKNLLFDDSRTREDGLNTFIMKKYLSDDTIRALRERFGNNYDQKLDELLKNISDFSKKNGCGAYSLLTIINSKYAGRTISKEEFFGEILLSSSINSKENGVYDLELYDKFKSLVSKRNGSINTKMMKNICNELNKRSEKYRLKKPIECTVIDKVPDGIDKNSDAYKKLDECLNNGGSAVTMLRASGEGNKNRQEVFAGEKVKLKDYAETAHYIAIKKKLDGNKVLAVDSRDFNDAANKISGKDWSGFTVENLEKLTFKEKNNNLPADKIGYNKQGGIILFE